jgi:hypothetical protein
MAGAACEVGVDVDAVAHLEVEHLGAESFDRARCVEPEDRERYQFEADEEGAPVTNRGLTDGVLDAVIRCILGLNTNARVSWL